MDSPRGLPRGGYNDLITREEKAMRKQVDLPLFPLGTVLFPNQLLPLHIFEDRYKLMVSECLRDSGLFGVVLIKEGREVGAPATPFDVGTTARIVEVEARAQGRLAIRTVGDRPFRIIEITRTLPYLRAAVEMLDYDQGKPADLGALTASVRSQFSTHLDILAALAGKERPAVDLDVGPGRLSYLVAATMALDMAEKQRLLETASAGERLRSEATILARENRALQAFVYLSEGEKRRKESEPPDGGLAGRISRN